SDVCSSDLQAEEVEQLRAPRRLRGARQAGVGQGVQCARLARVGTAGEGDFQTAVLGALVDLGGTDEEAGLLAQTDDGILREHGGYPVVASTSVDRLEGLRHFRAPAARQGAWQAASFPFQRCQYIMPQILCALCPTRRNPIAGSDYISAR